MHFQTQQRFVEKVVENGHVLKDLDYTTFTNGNQFVVQGYNGNRPFLLTNVPAKKKKPNTRRRRNKGFKRKSNTTTRTQKKPQK
jgi:hypothetical protein